MTWAAADRMLRSEDKLARFVGSANGVLVPLDGGALGEPDPPWRPWLDDGGDGAPEERETTSLSRLADWLGSIMTNGGM